MSTAPVLAIGLVPETESCDAILQAWYGGESGGQAVADVLFGDYNPSGKLPVTFYKDTIQLADFEDYSMKERTYRYMTKEPLFPFGFGLSYTKFSVGEARPDKTSIRSNEPLSLSIPITNTGKRSGTEILQVYVKRKDDQEGPLKKTLRGFKRVSIAAGTKTDAVILLTSSAFEFYDKKQLKMAVVPGVYELWVGNSSDQSQLKKTEIVIQ